MDFLYHYSLLVGLHEQRLLDSTMDLTVFGRKLNSPVFLITVAGNPYQSIWDSLPELPNLNFQVSAPTHTTKHISTKSAPVFSCPHPLPPEKLEAAKAKFNHMFQLRIISSFTSQWASLLHLVPKGFGNWRPTGDFNVSMLSPFLKDINSSSPRF